MFDRVHLFIGGKGRQYKAASHATIGRGSRFETRGKSLELTHLTHRSSRLAFTLDAVAERRTIALLSAAAQPDFGLLRQLHC